MKSFRLIVLFLLCSVFLKAQDNSDAEKAYSPTIGFGVGTIGFYGDLNDRDYGSPFTANPAFNAYIVQPVTDYLNVRFSFLVAQIREEERSLERNINFESDIRAGSMLLEYNFDHFLPEERKITPFITTGIEIAEFNPKTDLEAFGGERYNYWTDGTIRNVAENDPDAAQSVIIQRDYSYETDVREAGFNNSTTYSERAISIPVGVGVMMHLNDQFDFRLEGIMHLTFSDYFDGITPKTKTEFVGNKRGNANNDHFLYSGFSLSYNFQKVEGADKFERFDDSPVDFLASGNTEDFDSDGVIDLIDNCPNTPREVEVDSLGCPVDSDGDGVPDFKDKEPNSEYPEFANDEGVEMTDDMIYASYLNFIDSTLELAEVIERDFRGKPRGGKKYRVKVGEIESGETPENMEQLLELSDLNKINQGNTIFFTAGSYKTESEAVQRAKELRREGYLDAEVVRKTNSGKYIPLGNDTPKPTNVTNETPKVESSTSIPTAVPENTESTESKEELDQILFRVQLGAFKNKPTGDKYNSIPDLKVVQAGAYFRYMSGSFDNFQEAATHKVKMVVEGYKGAFVVAYKNGKRVSLKSVGVNPINSDPLLGK